MKKYKNFVVSNKNRMFALISAFQKLRSIFRHKIYLKFHSPKLPMLKFLFPQKKSIIIRFYVF